MGEDGPSRMLIAIDGPAASGKSAVGSALARKLGFPFLDTGSLYRAVTWLVLEHGIRPNDRSAVVALAATARIVVGEDSAGRQTVEINDLPATRHLRDLEVEGAVSTVSAIPEVRASLITIQRSLAGNRIVMAGRDIGSVVLPDAGLKLYLDASPEERARRRLAELDGATSAETPAALLEQLRRRDHIDSTRAVAPLTVPADAVHLHTDNLSLQDVIDHVFRLAVERWPELETAGMEERPATE
jgi:cytidylate kinase